MTVSPALFNEGKLVTPKAVVVVNNGIFAVAVNT